MRAHGHLYRLATAFLISIGLNGVLFAVDFSIDPRRVELSRIQRWVVGLLSPAEAYLRGGGVEPDDWRNIASTLKIP